MFDRLPSDIKHIIFKMNRMKAIEEKQRFYYNFLLDELTSSFIHYYLWENDETGEEHECISTYTYDRVLYNLKPNKYFFISSDDEDI